MDLHVPHGPVHSLKDFLIHLGIVTLGIMIALGLEQLVEAHHRASLAAEAVAAFRHELTDNRAQAKEVIDAMPSLHTQIQAEIARLLGPRPADGSASPAITYPGVTLDLVSHASWETAVATQALNELPYDRVKRYAAAYDSLRLFFDEENAGLRAWQELHRFGDDAAALTDDQRRALVEGLRGYDSQAIAVEASGKAALQQCDLALETPR